MSNDQFQQLLKILGDVGTLGYNAAVEKVYSDGYQALFWTVFGMVLSLTAIFMLRSGVEKLVQNKNRYRNEHDYSEDDRETDDVAPIIKVTFSVISLFFSLFLFSNVSTAITNLTAPHYQALYYLSRLVVK